MEQSSVFNIMTVQRLLEGLFLTFKISMISLIISFLGGIVEGIISTSEKKMVRFLTTLYLEVVRLIPILVWLFIFYFSIPILFKIHLEEEFVAILVFSFWGIAEIGDIVRGGIISISNHQKEAGEALGLSKVDIYRYILLPQAIRRIIPGSMNLGTRMIKTTSLLSLIGIIEVVKVGQQIIERGVLKEGNSAFIIYGMIMILYFVLCYPISFLSKSLEEKWS